MSLAINSIVLVSVDNNVTSFYFHVLEGTIGPNVIYI